ncbi:hypothetical protein PGB90_008144 [Kerria lacca]
MSSIYFQSLSKEEKQQFIDSFDNIVTDCDGVLWNANGIIEAAPETINLLTCSGKCIFFITNNSSKTKAQFHSKFQKYGFNVSEKNLFNTSTLTAKYLRNTLPSEKLVYVVGPEAVSDELKQYEIDSFGVGKEEVYDDILENIDKSPIEIKKNVGAVVVGFDKYINYIKILKAATYLKNKDCLFIATNTDETFPTSNEFIIPGTGAVLAGIQVASGREPFLIGKPSTYLSEVFKEEKIDPKRTLFIGDRCNTDILFGNKCSFKTLLVLSGVHSLEDVHKFETSSLKESKLSVPDYYTDSISDLYLK